MLVIAMFSVHTVLGGELNAYYVSGTAPVHIVWESTISMSSQVQQYALQEWQR